MDGEVSLDCFCVLVQFLRCGQVCQLIKTYAKTIYLTIEVSLGLDNNSIFNAFIIEMYCGTFPYQSGMGCLDGSSRTLSSMGKNVSKIILFLNQLLTKMIYGTYFYPFSQDRRVRINYTFV